MAKELKRGEDSWPESTTMKNDFLALLLSLLCAPILFTSAANAQVRQATSKSPSPLIGNLKRLRNFGCDCKFQTLKEARSGRADKFVFQSDLAAIPAWMNIDGNDVSLKLIYASPASNGVLLGSRSYKKYQAKGISVLIRYVVNAICPEENPDCDEAGYIATITVSKDGRRQSIKATGMCGWC
jgi:hypothetical protein